MWGRPSHIKSMLAQTSLLGGCPWPKHGSSYSLLFVCWINGTRAITGRPAPPFLSRTVCCSCLLPVSPEPVGSLLVQGSLLWKSYTQEAHQVTSMITRSWTWSLSQMMWQEETLGGGSGWVCYMRDGCECLWPEAGCGGLHFQRWLPQYLSSYTTTWLAPSPCQEMESVSTPLGSGQALWIKSGRWCCVTSKVKSWNVFVASPLFLGLFLPGTQPPCCKEAQRATQREPRHTANSSELLAV